MYQKSFPYPPPSHVEEEEEEDVDNKCDTYQQHSVNQVKESSELADMKEKLLSEYSTVFKEDLGPSDTSGEKLKPRSLWRSRKDLSM